LKYTTPGTNAFLTATYSVMVPFMMWAVTRKRPTAFNVVAAVLGMIGVGLVSFDGSLGSFNFMGEGMTLLCGVAFALQIICIATIGKGQDAIQFTIFELLSCGVCMLILYLSLELKEPIALNGDAIFNLSYLTIMGTAVALFIMTWGMKYASAASSALIMSLEAVFGVIFSIIFYKERLTLRVGIGFMIIFIAVIISEYFGLKFGSKKSKQVQTPENNIK
ncbi:MAG: DMT family transporter, partial [Clostridia bacterium]|nr:DMT family transporter [Clostridia bacterium]